MWISEFFSIQCTRSTRKTNKKKIFIYFCRGPHTYTHRIWLSDMAKHFVVVVFIAKNPNRIFFSLSLIYSYWFTLTESYTTLSVYVCMYVCVWFLLIHIDFFIQKKPVLMLMPVAIVYKWKSKHNQTFFYIIIIIIIIFNMHVNPGNSFVIYLFIYLFFYISILPNQCVCVLMASKMMNFFVWNFQHKNKMEKMYWEREWRERE